jgi:hypothetical protein
MRQVVWEMQEPGWWTSELGGICNDGRNWYFWPRGGKPDDPKIGPWKSLKQAKEKAATVSNGER